jgi:hypothetical protein
MAATPMRAIAPARPVTSASYSGWGAGTQATTSAITEAPVTPRASPSTSITMRWASTGSASTYTSLGVTNVRPCMSARARAAHSSATEPRGDAPSVTPGASRVAATNSTM